MTNSIYTGTLPLRDRVNSGNPTDWISTNTPSTRPATQINNSGWHLEDLHPEGWFCLKSGQDALATIFGTLTQGNPDTFQWVYPKCYVNLNGRYQPYCYTTLCKVVLPMLFGIWALGDQVIQVDLMSIRRGLFKYRTLTHGQLRSYIYHETNRVISELNPPEGHIIRRVFNNEMWHAKREDKHFIRLPGDFIECYLPQLEIQDNMVPVFLMEALSYGKPGVIHAVLVEIKNNTVVDRDLMVVESLLNKVGIAMTREELDSELDFVDFYTDNKYHRVKMLNSLLEQHSHTLVSKKVGKKKTPTYTVCKLTATITDVQPLNYPGNKLN